MISGAQADRLDYAPAVDVDPVGTAHVDDPIFVIFFMDHGVAAGDTGLTQDYVIARFPAKAADTLHGDLIPALGLDPSLYFFFLRHGSHLPLFGHLSKAKLPWGVLKPRSS